ncbi:LacI family DNA-binding transcriptional regulator [Azospirillum doebereinerae]
MARRSKQQVTIIDVARELGLAPSTVSNALRGKPEVAPDTRARVLATCEAMNYVASPVARALRVRCSFTIGVLLPDISNPVFGDIIKGLDGVLAPAGFATLLASTENGQGRLLSAARTFIQREVDALVMISQPVEGEGMDDLLDWDGPILVIHRRTPKAALDYVGMDNVGGGEAAVRHLAGLGHRRIAFIEGPRLSSSARERLAGYRKAVQELGLESDPALVCSGDYTLSSGFQAARRILAAERRPTAIVAANDLMACAVMDIAVHMGLQPPKDLSVIGFDDVFISSFPQIALTTVRQPAAEIGRAAGRRLLDRLSADATAPRDVVLPAELVVRASTGPAAIRPRPARKLTESDLEAHLRHRWRPTTEVYP